MMTMGLVFLGQEPLLKNMLSGASSSALVLIDEFGSGTEPVIGGAIAEAILERLLAKGASFR